MKPVTPIPTIIFARLNIKQPAPKEYCPHENESLSILATILLREAPGEIVRGWMRPGGDSKLSQWDSLR